MAALTPSAATMTGDSAASTAQLADMFVKLAELAAPTPSSAWEASLSAVVSSVTSGALAAGRSSGSASAASTAAVGPLSRSTTTGNIGVGGDSRHMVSMSLSALRLASELAAHHPALMQRALSTMLPCLLNLASDGGCKEVREDTGIAS